VLCLGLAFALASMLHVSAPRTAESLAFAIVPRQGEARSCGYAVLAGLLRYAGIDQYRDIGSSSGSGTITESSLLERYGDLDVLGGIQPLSLKGMIGILADYGIPSIPLKIDPAFIDDALRQRAPLILHFNKPTLHFALGLGAEGGRVAIADPVGGLGILAERDLAARASGYVLAPLLSGPEAIAFSESARSAIQEAMKRGAFLEARAKEMDSMPAGGGSAADFRMEAGIRTGSCLGQTGIEIVSTTIFFSGDWNMSKALTLLFGASFTIQPADRWKGKIRLESGLEWHGETQGEGQSLGLALMGAAESGAFVVFAQAANDRLDASALECPVLEPGLRLRYSAVVDPWLLTGRMGAGLPLRPGASPSAGKGLLARELAVRPVVSALCAFSSSIAGIAELGQSFIASLDGSAMMRWEGTLELGMYIQAGNVLFRAGTRFRLDGGSGPRGDVVFSCAL